MKKIFRFLVLMFCISALTNPVLGQWVQVSKPGGGRTYCFAASDSNLYAGTDNAVFLSTDGGTNWNIVNAGLPTTSVTALSGVGGNLVATSGVWVFTSSNGGINWTAAGSGLTTDQIYALAVKDTLLFVGGYGGVFRSSDMGASWTAVNVGMTSRFVYSLVAGNIGAYAGTIDGVFGSTNNGSAWSISNSGLTDLIINVLAICNGVLFAGTQYHGIFRSTNNGTNWAAVNTGTPAANSQVHAVATDGQRIVALIRQNVFSSYVDSMYLSVNGGGSWKSADLPPIHVNAFAFSGSNLLAGTDNGVWRRPLSDVISGVKEDGNNIPTRFSLEQNYPNPFNPTARIRFSVPWQTHATIKVFDVLGKEAAVLFDEQLVAGTYQVTFDGSHLSSGVYYYRFQAGDFTQTKKLVLVK